MSKQYLPWVTSSSESTLYVPLTRQLAKMILEAPWQRRKNGRIHPTLMLAAQRKANDMSKRNYFSHVDPDGGTVNEYIRAAGYPLPSYYPEKGNNCESLRLGPNSPADAVRAWLDSPGHRMHVAGEIDFYAEQIFVGVGTAPDPDGQHIWVFISAP